MYKEIGRKITSLTLLSILLASGVTFGIPGALPAAEASHNANLFVSSENSQFSNYFAGPQVIEVVINDPNIADTDQGEGEPDVSVNGNKLRMVQATDGNWYGYFADRTQALAADATQADGSGEGLDFGKTCTAASANTAAGLAAGAFSQTTGVAFDSATSGGAFVPGTLSVCTGTGGLDEMHVVREEKLPSDFPSPDGSVTTAGQIGITTQAWPFVQLYDLSAGGNVIVKYNKGGGAQTTTLTFDTIPSNIISTSLDRTQYPKSAQVHVTMADPQLNIDPTDEDSWTWDTSSTSANVYYQLFDENGGSDVLTAAGAQDLTGNLTSLMFEKNGRLTVNLAAQTSTVGVLNDNNDQVFPITAYTPSQGALSQQMTFTELDVKSGVFGNYDEADNANLDTTATAGRGESATIRYNDVSKSIVVNFNFGAMAITVADGEWNSGEEVPVTYTDMDLNLNSRADEDLDLFDPVRVDLPTLPIFFSIPTMKIGNPFTLAGSGDAEFFSTTVFTVVGPGNRTFDATGSIVGTGGSTLVIEDFSDRGIVDPATTTTIVTGPDGALVIDLNRDLGDLKASIKDPRSTSSPRFKGLDMLNFDLRSLATGTTGTITDVEAYLLVNNTDTAATTGPGFTLAGLDTTTAGIRAYSLGNSTTLQDLINLNKTDAGAETSIIYDNIFSTSLNDNSDSDIALMFVLDSTALTFDGSIKPIVADFFTFGFTGDGLKTNERFNNAIYRFELEETGDNTGVFLGSAEFTMLNQLNILDDSTYEGLRTIDDEVTFIVHEDLTDEDGPKISIKDTLFHGPPGTETGQADADTHSGTVSFDGDSYKIGQLVVITLNDQDLNADSDLIDIYVTVTPVTGEPASDTVGEAGLGTFSNGDPFGRLLDITFDDERWLASTVAPTCTTPSGTGTGDGLTNVGFSMIETGPATGTFTGSFEIPTLYCSRNLTTPTMASPTGTDIEVNYVDFRDGSGETIEVGDGAGVRANTGSISLDRTVYPLPFGKLSDFTGQTIGSAPNRQSFFPLHATATGTTITTGETIAEGDMTIHVRINDEDFNFGPFGLDSIGTFPAIATTSTGFGPVKVTVSRGSDSVILAYAGASAPALGVIDAGVKSTTPSGIRELGPITEIAPDAGIYEFDLPILYTDGPASTNCPTTGLFTGLNGSSTSTSSLARFDAAGSYCILQGDILTVEYSDPTDATGNPNTVTDSATFDIRNGVLQSDKSVYIIGADMILTLIEPDFDLDSDGAESYSLDLIEWDSDAATTTLGSLGGGASFDPEPSEFRETGDSTGIFQVVIEIPNNLFGEQLDRGEEIELEYTDWAPSGADFVGDEDQDINLTIYTSNFGATVELDQKVYTWTDKVFITIVAPDHNFDSNLIDEIGDTSIDKIQVSTRGERLSTYRLAETGTDTGIFTGEVILTGFSAHDADGDGTIGDAPGTGPTGSGPTNGLLPAKDDDGLSVSFEFTEDETIVGSALIRWNIGEVQFLEASYPATGQGVVRVIDPDMNINPESVDNFDIDMWSDSDAGGIDLTVTETNEATGIFEGTVFFTVTDQSSGSRLRVAEGDTVTGEYEDNTLPNPYTTADELEITATTFIGTIVPPLERAPASNPRVVDAFGNELDTVSVDQQVQITADLANGQDRDQPFAYLVQISKGGVTWSLSWITGSLAPGQSLNPAQSWTPSEAGTYDVQIFVWESVDNPDALSPQVETTITVR